MDTLSSVESVSEAVNRLILDLSLVTSYPVGCRERNFVQAAAAANSIANLTSNLNKNQLREFVWTVQPLIQLLILDIYNPAATKAARSLRCLMPSRVCMTELIDSGGLLNISKVLDIPLAKSVNELKVRSSSIRDLVEHLAVCYREIARFHPWNLVDVGALRHCVSILRFGDVSLQTISAATMASLSSDLEICKQMFSYGAIKPLLNISDADKTDDACMLAGLGCIIQLCRIPEISVRLVQQGCVPVLEKALHRHIGHSNIMIREKALYSFGFLSNVQEVRSKLCTDGVLKGLRNEFYAGTMGSKTTVLQFIMNCHNKYSQEKEVARSLRKDVLHLMKTAPWMTRNLCVKTFCVVYQSLEDRKWFADGGMIETLLDILRCKDGELQEAPVVAFLHMSLHPELPHVLLQKGVAKAAVSILGAEDPIIAELALILLKGLYLYNNFEIERCMPKEKLYLLNKDVFNPRVYGQEYGGMIEEYLQQVVENRRADNYLIKQFTEDEIEALQLTSDDLNQYQNTFMQIDAECLGVLGLDELKMLMVLMGERMDREELQLLLEEYDTDHSGALDFKEFAIMMKGWSTRFGTGWIKVYNEATKRGAIGKSLRYFKKWWNRDRLEAAQVANALERRRAAKENIRSLELNYRPHEMLALKRAQAIEFRELLEAEAQEDEEWAMYNNTFDQSTQPSRQRSQSVSSSVSSVTLHSSTQSMRLPPILKNSRSLASTGSGSKNIS